MPLNQIHVLNGQAGAGLAAHKGAEMAAGTVVLVPGTAGSELYWERVPFVRPVAWLSPPTLLAGAFNQMSLPVSGEGGSGLPVGSFSGGGPLPFYYGILMDRLTRAGWSVLAPQLDWRREISHSAAILAQLIRASAHLSPLKVVAHSRGGLVVRKALALLAASGQLSLVSRVVGLGVPHTGSLVSAQYLACYAPAKRILATMGAFLPSMLTQIIGLRNVHLVSRTWPSLYELLPAPSATWLNTTRLAQLWLPATWHAAGVAIAPSLLTAAATAWQQLPPSPGQVDWIDVYGTQLPTPADLPEMTQLARRGSMPVTTDGDGVVLAASARQPGRVGVSVACAHDALPQHGGVLSWLSTALVNGQAGDLHIPGSTLGAA